MGHCTRVGAIVGWTLGLLLMSCSGTSVDGARAEVPLSAKVQRFKLNDSGGFGPAPCDLGGSQYTFEMATRQLDIAYCDYSVSPVASVTGTRALSAPEVDSVAQALDKVRPSNAKNCGADASVVTLDATTANGVEVYADDFYSGCPWEAQAGRQFVTGLPDLEATLARLGRVTP